MRLKEWIARYNEKAPEPFQRDRRFTLHFLPARGFCEVGQTADMLLIHQLCGDARFWRDRISSLARKLKKARCGTICIRPEIKAYIRLFGFRVEKEEPLPHGLFRYHCRHKETGKRGLASPAFQYLATGKTAYFITWEP
jgi:hypothetical protein